MSIRKTSSGRWRAVVKNGRNYVAGRTFDRKADAEAWERRQRAALDGLVDPRAGRVLVRQALDEWLDHRRGRVAQSTWARDASVTSRLPAALLQRQVGSVKPTDIERVLSRVIGATATVERTRITLAAFWTWCVREGLVLASPVAGVKVSRSVGAPPREMRPWTWTELDLVTEQMQKVDAAMADVVRILAWTGLRWGEARALRVDAVVGGDMPVLRISRSHSEGYAEKVTKGKANRSVPIPMRVWPLVREMADGRPGGDYLFTTGRGAQLHKSNFRRALKWSLYAPGHTIHDLRHTAATEWLRAGVDLRTVQAWLGHESISATQVYVHYLGTAADRAGFALVNAFGGTPGAPEAPTRDDTTTVRPR
ncbi:tyrosine-type recombinase/integrase [Georgenia wutianyii]|uniref:tyrosine-type recombinase/integrase n=1 Tax=Georgenia wutianyii TaxID=2585135 RepID=UPI00143E0BD3|nr:site-specific integrase [Georgenia wutianyii]